MESIEDIKTFIALTKRPIDKRDIDGYDSLIYTIPQVQMWSFETGDYQGDLFYLLRLGDHWGFVSTGYGSCSGCDAYQAAADGVRSLEELRDELLDDIIWQTNAQKMIEWLEGRDWEGQWYRKVEPDIRSNFLPVLRDATQPQLF